jgi:hypothetical protein
MPKLMNTLAQPVLINCRGRVLHLLPGYTTAVSDTEFQSEGVQGLLRQRALELVPTAAKAAARGPAEPPLSDETRRGRASRST